MLRPWSRSSTRSSALHPFFTDPHNANLPLLALLFLVRPFLSALLSIVAAFLLPNAFYPPGSSFFLDLLSPFAIRLSGWDYPDTTYIYGHLFWTFLTFFLVCADILLYARYCEHKSTLRY